MDATFHRVDYKLYQAVHLSLWLQIFIGKTRYKMQRFLTNFFIGNWRQWETLLQNHINIPGPKDYAIDEPMLRRAVFTAAGHQDCTAGLQDVPVLCEGHAHLLYGLRYRRGAQPR
jgi:hypothetical protein